MRDRKLSIDDALDGYLVYQLRLSEFLHLFQIAMDIKEKRYDPTTPIPYSDFFGTIRSAMYGWFASLIDKQPAALNVFDVWLTLYPDEEKEIQRVWAAIEPYKEVIAHYRNHVAFHANKSIKHYFESRNRFNELKTEIGRAMQEFFGLASKLIKKPPTVVENFYDRVKERLTRAVPGADPDEFIKVFIVDKPAGDGGNHGN
jgi:hypothetical protein